MSCSSCLQHEHGLLGVAGGGDELSAGVPAAGAAAAGLSLSEQTEAHAAALHLG